MTTVEQAELRLTTDAKMVSNYGDKFITVTEDSHTLYLLKGTIVSKYNVIASVNMTNECKLFDREGANFFVEWSHQHYGQNISIENLPDSQIQQYIKEYLQNDIYSLMQFEETSLDNEQFKKYFDKLSDSSRATVLSALEKAGIFSADQHKFLIPYMITKSESHINWSRDNLYSYAALYVTKDRYDVCERDSLGNYIVLAKNGHCGSLAKYRPDSDERCYIIFDKKPESSIAQTTSEDSLSREELEAIVDGSPYHAAFRLVKLEEAFEKEVEAFVTLVGEHVGYVDLNKIYHPDIDNYIETSAKLVREAHKPTITPAGKDFIVEALGENYTKAQKELRKSHVSLIALKDEFNKKLNTTV